MKIFKLPDLGEGLQEAEIVEWHVKAGDEIAIALDPAASEFYDKASGRVEKVVFRAVPKAQRVSTNP